MKLTKLEGAKLLIRDSGDCTVNTLACDECFYYDHNDEQCNPSLVLSASLQYVKDNKEVEARITKSDQDDLADITQLESTNNDHPKYVKQLEGVNNLSEIDVLMLADICESLLEIGIGKIDSLEWSRQSQKFYEIKDKLK